jgi:hypothetical protein
MEDLKMHDEESLVHILLREQLEYYRLQRHDFMNHGQVIMGYLQLGKADKALEYMREMIGDFEAEQAAGQIPQETVGAIILGLILALRKEQFPVDFYLDEQMKSSEFWKEFWREEYGQALYGYTRECIRNLYDTYREADEERPDVFLYLDEIKGCSVT